MDKKIDVQINSLSLNGVIENSEAKKLIILVHGFAGDWRGPAYIFEKLSKKLQQLDYAVLRFNFRGTPPSEGDFIDMTVATETEDLKEIIQYAKSLGYVEIGVLGESMGGTIAVTAYDPSLKIVIFWYPAFDFSDTDFKDLFFTKSAQKEISDNGYFLCDGLRVGTKFIDEVFSINVFDDLRKIKCPTLILHGDKDDDVPLKQSKKAFEILNEPKEIRIIRGANHGFVQEQSEVIELTTKFIQRYFR